MPLRILLFYVGALAVIMMLAPWNTITGDASPFVSIFDGLGIPAAPHILNFVVITAALSAINSDVFGAGRMIFGLAEQGQAPRVFLRVSRNGVPWATVALMVAALSVGAWWDILAPCLALALLGIGLSLLNFAVDEIANPRLRTGGRLARWTSLVKSGEGRL